MQTHACLYVCTDPPTHRCMHTHTHTHTQTHAHTHTDACMHACTHARTHTHTCKFVLVHTLYCLCSCVYACTNPPTHRSTRDFFQDQLPFYFSHLCKALYSNLCNIHVTNWSSKFYSSNFSFLDIDHEHHYNA